MEITEIFIWRHSACEYIALNYALKWKFCVVYAGFRYVAETVKQCYEKVTPYLKHVLRMKSTNMVCTIQYMCIKCMETSLKFRLTTLQL